MDTRSSESAVITVEAGVRALICMMPVPRRMFFVRPAITPSATTASIPQASADQTESMPIASAASTKASISSQSSPS